MEKDSDLLNKKKTVQISVTDKDGKEHPIDVETEISDWQLSKYVLLFLPEARCAVCLL